MKKNTAGVSTPSLDDNTSSVNVHDEVEPNTPEDFKVILKTVFEAFGDRIDTNAQSIAKITDLMSRLSTQMTKLMSERNNGSSSIIQVDNNRGSSTNAGFSLVDLTGSPHQYASRFGAPYDDPMAELMELKQTGNVREVHEQFDSYLSRLQLPPQCCFMTALNEDIIDDIEEEPEVDDIEEEPEVAMEEFETDNENSTEFAQISVNALSSH
ncbi:hypothetical protein Tco_0766680 [Tanacetum coccineum]|uniref:Uncharacterized protein n=1 Tax=Tanacetum coccineum TaxID=301880 RepID=A0ABQ5BU99_9ASTR